MVWCSNCATNIRRPDNVDGKICCNLCGRVLDEDNFSQEPTFVKNAAGQSQLSGNLVKTVNGGPVSRERTLNEAYDGITSIMYAMEIDGGDSIANPALRFYTRAVESNFTKGRRKEQVQAACLYICCRVNGKPYLLIDFSEYLRINVKIWSPYLASVVWNNQKTDNLLNVLGDVHFCMNMVKLSKLLSLHEHPTFLKPVDPSLFIHRFTDCLFNGRIPSPTVSSTALHIVASMKRDWMQTGRKPSGLCGAALYISALSHGLKCSKSEIIRVVHVCEATLTKRLIEFENTESGGLTIEEFEQKASEFEKKENLMESFDTGPESSGISELLCEHKNSAEPPFAHGLCRRCYKEFIKISGGFNGGSEPPAFQRAERERIMAMEAAADSSENLDFSTLPGLENNSKLLNSDEQWSIKNMSECKATQPADTDQTGATLQSKVIDDSSDGRIPADPPSEESETFSDIDDNEVNVYLNSEEEKKLKKIVWEKMNKEYLEEQAAKVAAETAAREAYEANFSNCSDDVKAAQKLAAAAAEAVAKSKKEKRQKRAAEMKNAGPPQSAAEATKRMLDKKRLSSKIRYDVLEKLFDESENPESIKRTRTETKSDGEDNYLNNSKEDDPEFEGNEDPHIDNMEDNVEAYDYDDDYIPYDGF